jgi:hypothetical protein
MSIDTSCTLEIGLSPWKNVAQMAFWAAWTILLAAMPFQATRGPGDIFYDPKNFSYLDKLLIVVVFVGYILLTFYCALFAGVVLRRLLTMRGPVLTLSPAGIRDLRVAAETLAWSAVHNIWIANTLVAYKLMLFEVDQRTETGLTLTRTAKWSRWPNRFTNKYGLGFPTFGLAMSQDDVISITLAYANAWVNRQNGMATL